MSTEAIRSNIDTLRRDFKKHSPDLEIGSISDGGSKYLVYLTQKGLKKGDALLDNQYTWDKKTHKIEPFRVTDDPTFYDIATRHIIYMKQGLRDD